MNSLNYADETENETSEPYEAAERSALQLWNALDDFRMNIHKGKKRKHAETEDTSTTALWNRMEAHEKHQVTRRKQILEKVCVPHGHTTTPSHCTLYLGDPIHLLILLLP